MAYAVARLTRGERASTAETEILPPDLARRLGAALGARFPDEFRRLPGLRDELARAGVRPLVPPGMER